MTGQALTGDLRQLLEDHGVHAVYQPIVDLAAFEAVGYEALVRGPAGSPLESPGALFGLAAEEGLTAELDHACRNAAVAGAAAAAERCPLTLFVNVEPGHLGRGLRLFDDDQRATLADGRIRVVIELTERALTRRPAELLSQVERLRSLGVGIALDDVGIDDRSLALIPFVQPDVVKLDMRLVQDAPTRELARIANAVWAEAERSGAHVLAEGIETEEHLRRALAIGARLGQGWMFGRPGTIGIPSRPGEELAVRAPAPIVGQTPFEIVSAQRATTRGSKAVLLERSLQLEAEAFGLAPEGVVLATFQDNDFFTPPTARRYHRLGRALAFVGAFGAGMPERPIECVRGGDIDAGETLRGEWNVIVLGPHFAGAFVARDLGDGGPDSARRFDFAMTYERELVVQAARSLMARVVRST